MSDNNGGWLKALLMWDWHDISLKGWPGWERSRKGDAPISVRLTVVSGKTKSSRDMAVAFDDVAAGRFYYRDWTDSGIPFVKGGEIYQSAFWFQLREDQFLFLTMFGGCAEL